MTVERGLDPRDFTVFAYGGAGPVFAPFITRQIGAKTAYIPADSGMFSALGMLTTDLVFTEERTSVMSPPLDGSQLDSLNGLLALLSERVRGRFVHESFGDSGIVFRRTVEMRFRLQVHQLEIDLPDHDVTTADIDGLIERFVETYEQTYGKNSAYMEAGIEMVNFRVSGTVALERPELAHDSAGTTGGGSQTGSRAVRFSTGEGFIDTAIHAGNRLTPGQGLDGPAIIQRFGDTVVVPPDTISRSIYGGLVMTLQKQA